MVSHGCLRPIGWRRDKFSERGSAVSIQQISRSAAAASGSDDNQVIFGERPRISQRAGLPLCLPCEPALCVVRLGCAASLYLQTHIASQSAASQGAAPSSLPVKKERPSDLSSLPGRPFSRLAGFLRVCSYAWIRVLSDVPKPLATSRLGGDEWV